MTTYSEKLKDPRWQKRRLEVMEKASFKCEYCGDKESTLHIHHDIYLPNKEPWEHDDIMLRCFCESCHEYETKLRRLLILKSKLGEEHV